MKEEQAQQPKKPKRGNGEGCIRPLGDGSWEARIMIGWNDEGKQKI